MDKDNQSSVDSEQVLSFICKFLIDLKMQLIGK